MLAQAAQRSGMKPLAIDLWGDIDTLSSAKASQQIPTLDAENLLPALNYFLYRYPVTRAIYGSGFERCLDSLKCVNDRLTLFGNSPDVLAELHNKYVFFSILETLGISFPEVSFDTPYPNEGWLIKPTHSQGGVGIRRYRPSETIEEPSYWQKYQEGEPHSVLFLADGRRSQIIGFNRQWTIAVNEKDEFVFSGITNSTQLSYAQKNRISDWLVALIPRLKLKGLNSLDFIQCGETSYVLEINPRPPASMQLYNADLFARHIKSCQGELLGNVFNQVDFAGYQIIYAQEETRIPAGINWPEGVVDIPHAGSIISTGQPICSIITHSQKPDKVLEQLRHRQELITQQFHRLQIHGIQCQRQ